MPIIKTELHINAPIQVCFDLARSIDVHMESTAHTHERAIAGVTSGLIELNQTVTWVAVHFGIKQSLTAKITELDAPTYFVDEMVSGVFKRFRHEHRFMKQENGTLMLDYFDYTSPLGYLGILADRLFLENYMKKFLMKRNEYIKSVAEQMQSISNP
ncbi:ligand-binding SRPBCC domain-containing protein [Croceifilum oryzae]|uniref:Ligand-binding SRPBCC domain-containing protein n=1 Tax=Croceifilum oryzae TaxID=1553429 RepID=A0AAJ1WR92_9BACL|nr:SRPBCC family protein [Croceifilum oryzae]MDQ0416320.1 ligand-binding SRPBCC domain-containing protein [Croceifilum oryzae]